MNKLALVTGAGGFIGGHMVKRLLDEKYTVVAVDNKHVNRWYQKFKDARNYDMVDCSDLQRCTNLVYRFRPDEMYVLGQNMGGMGFIESNHAACGLNVLTNTNMLLACKNMNHRPDVYFFPSSACLYSYSLQNSTQPIPLSEDMAFPADPRTMYGLEKLFSEELCRYFRQDFDVPTYVGRFHGIYGPHGDWSSDRAKAPAALCRKFVEAQKTGLPVEIWGNGEQRRTFTYIDDCVEGVWRLCHNDRGFHGPVNIATSELVSINNIVDILEDYTGFYPERVYKLDAPQGVVGRTTDNTLIKDQLNWEPTLPFRDGIIRTYEWIKSEINK